MNGTALVVGGSRGIGAAIVSRLETLGYDTAEMSRTSGCDVTKRDELHDALRALHAAPDVLVYCAGHVEPRPLLEVDDDDWDYHLDVNLTAARHVLAWWGRRRVKWHAGAGGVAILVASTAALRPSPGWSSYSAPKAGLVNLGLTAAVELAAHKLRCYVVAPGRCATHLRATLAPDEDQSKIMRPEEVADVAAMLIADTGGVLAGQVVEVARRC